MMRVDLGRLNEALNRAQHCCCCCRRQHVWTRNFELEMSRVLEKQRIAETTMVLARSWECDGEDEQRFAACLQASSYSKATGAAVQRLHCLAALKASIDLISMRNSCDLMLLLLHCRWP